MSKFVKSEFRWDGMNLTYGEDHRFVARFKTARSERAGFTSFLIKNFSTEEYFRRLEAGESPVEILRDRGYVSATVKRLLKSMGFAATPDGFAAYLAQRRVEAVAARLAAARA